MRSKEHPYGLPGLLPHHSATVEVANKIAVMTAAWASEVHFVGDKFVGGNPGNAYLWQLREYVKREKLKGVFMTKFYNCVLGRARHMLTILLTNMAERESTSRLRARTREANAT